jgi:hypothetical protein
MVLATRAVRFARRVFGVAGIYGLTVLLPQYFMEGRIGRDYPPPITHPEHFYGFVGIALAWQAAFLVIAKDPVRFRPFMVPAILEKATFAIAVAVLYLQNRVSGMVLGFGAFDLLLGSLFFVAWLRLR